MRAPFRLLFAFLLCLSLAGVAAAQDPLLTKAEALKAGIEDELSYLRPFRGEFIVPHARNPVTVQTWTQMGLQGGELKKMAIDAPDDHGAVLQELYYRDGALAYVVETVVTTPMDKGPERRTSNYSVFADGEMILWVDQRGAPRQRDSAAFTVRSRKITQTSGLLAAQVTAQRMSGFGPIERTSGRFSAIEIGDYYHLLIDTPNGDGASFFILQSDPTIDELINNPDPYLGKEVVIYWQTSVEHIPEAGGDIPVEVALAVQLPKP